MSTIPLYELHQHDEQDLHVLQSHVQETRPFSQLILCCAENTKEYILQSPAKQEILQSWFNDQKDVRIQTLLSLIEQLLSTAIYLGLGETFCAILIIELVYFVKRKNINLCLYNSTDKNEVSWKHFPNHPFLDQCLHKDTVFKPQVSFLSNKQKGLFFISFDAIIDASNAIEAGNIRFLELLQPDPHTYLTKFAARHGQLEVLKWLRSRGYPWNSHVCDEAAANDHLELLKWARDRECPWNANTCISAAQNGRLEILKWLHEQKCPWGESTCTKAALGGYLETLKWLKEQGCPWDTSTCSHAAYNGHLELLQWARGQACPWDSWTITRATQGGHLHVLKWAIEQGCALPADICTTAAEHGHLEILQMLRRQGCTWDELTCAYAAQGGFLEIIQFARENGCRWDGRTLQFAYENGHIIVAKWAEDHGCPQNFFDCERIL